MNAVTSLARRYVKVLVVVDLDKVEKIIAQLTNIRFRAILLWCEAAVSCNIVLIAFDGCG